MSVCACARMGLTACAVALFACGTAQQPPPPKPQAQANPLARGYPHTADDVYFMSGMIHHHAQAILIAGWAPTHGAGDPVRRLAERIVVAQRDEVDIMQNWLRDRGEPVPPATPSGMKMKMDGMEHEMLMPGMLSDEQLKQLDAARGRDFDRLFLTFMIQHHQGAITMVEKLQASYGAAQDEIVFRFSSDVVADQSTEIDRMEKMLADLETH